MLRSRTILPILIIILLGTGCVTLTVLLSQDVSYRSFGKAPSSWSYLRGYCEGIKYAMEELSANKAVILVAGDGVGMLDRETGLRIWATGCCPDKGVEGYVDGYNRTIQHYIRWKGYPQNSRKQWEGILFNLNAYFDRRAQSEEPGKLIVDGSQIVFPDGKTSMWLRSREFDPNRYHLRWNPDGLCSSWPISPRNNLLQFFWGPPKSDLLIFRGSAGDREKTELIGAFDTREGFWLKFDKEREMP